MTPDELVYLKVLGASIPLGFLFRFLSPPVKQGAALLLGLIFTISTCHIHTLHSLLTVLGTWVIIKVSWRRAPALSLSWTFLYLLFFRLVTWFGLPPPTSFANAIQLLLTLKMVSLANEVQSFHLEKEKEKEARPLVGALSEEPTFYDVLSYSYCYVGVMTGPFFRFRTYLDWLRQPRPWALPALTPCLQRLKLVPVYVGLYLSVNSTFPLSYVREEQFLHQPFLYRLFYMVAVFFVFRMRFYAAWCGAEAACISAALGCYQQEALSRPGGGPTVSASPDPSTEEKFDFRTIQNIDCYNTDFCVKVRHGMHFWNMTVQWWLRHYIYPNAPFKAYTLKAAWTMFISAYWHGLHVGYYLSFLTIPLCIAAETAMENSVRSRLGTGGQRVFDWVHWFLKMRAYDYMCMAFVLLSGADTISYWSSVYFIVHVGALLCIIVGRMLKGGGAGRKGDKEMEKEQMNQASAEKTE